MNESTIRKQWVRSEYIREREKYWRIKLNYISIHVPSDCLAEIKKRAQDDVEACDAAGYEWVPEPPKISRTLTMWTGSGPVRLCRPDGTDATVEELTWAAVLYNACGNPARLAAKLHKITAYLDSYMPETREIGECLRSLADRLDGRDA